MSSQYIVSFYSYYIQYISCPAELLKSQHFDLTKETDKHIPLENQVQ